MKNDKQIASPELSFGPFSDKFVTIIQYAKSSSWNVWIRIMYDILRMTKSVILTAIMTQYWKKLSFFKVNQIIMPTSQWHRNKDGIGHSITLIIKSAYCTVCTVEKFVVEVYVSLNLAYAK